MPGFESETLRLAVQKLSERYPTGVGMSRGKAWGIFSQSTLFDLLPKYTGSAKYWSYILSCFFSPRWDGRW